MEYDIGSKIKAVRMEKKVDAGTACRTVGSEPSDDFKLGKTEFPK